MRKYKMRNIHRPPKIDNNSNINYSSYCLEIHIVILQLIRILFIFTMFVKILQNPLCSRAKLWPTTIILARSLTGQILKQFKIILIPKEIGGGGRKDRSFELHLNSSFRVSITNAFTIVIHLHPEWECQAGPISDSVQTLSWHYEESNHSRKYFLPINYWQYDSCMFWRI
jgi:hypothetical protein